MVGWSHLPPEIKQHVVKKLDYMSRHSLRNTSYTDRQIVNSTPLKIPRVRFGHKNGRCLIVIYTGAEQFLRWELFDEDDGVTLQRCENCYDTAEFKRMTIQNADSLQMGINIMSNLLAHESIKIDVFEWDIPCKNEEEAEERMHKIIEYSNGNKFRVSEILSNSNPGCGIISTYLYFICCEVRELKTLYVDSSDINIFPHKTVEFKTVTDDVSYGVICILYEELDEIEKLPEDAFEEIGKYEDVKFSCAIEREMTPERTPAQQPTRSEENGFIKLTYTTECGKYITKMFPKDEQFIKNQLIDMKCGMSWLCQKCADPFEYWYHQNLTMRLIHEPFWAFALEGDEEPSEQMMNLLKQNVKKLPKTFKSSWGFERVPPKLQTTEKPKKKKNRKMKELELEDLERQEPEKRGKKANWAQRILAGILIIFIWFGIIFISCIVVFVVLDLVEKVHGPVI